MVWQVGISLRYGRFLCKIDKQHPYENTHHFVHIAQKGCYLRKIWFGSSPIHARIYNKEEKIFQIAYCKGVNWRIIL